MQLSFLMGFSFVFRPGFLVVLMSLTLTSRHGFAEKRSCFQYYSSSSTKAYNKNGIKGRIVYTTDPFDLLPVGKFEVILIDEIPVRPNPASKIFWLKDPKSHGLVRSLVKNGVPVVLGTIPAGSVADSFVPPPFYEISKDVLAAKKDKVHKHIIFLQAHVREDVIAHETQHWLDYQDGTFARFVNQLFKFKKQARLSNEEFTFIQDAVVEIRGHARQEIVLLESGKAEKADLDYVASLYQPYSFKLSLVLNRLESSNKAKFKELLDLLLEYQLPTRGKIQFSLLLKNYIKRAKSID